MDSVQVQDPLYEKTVAVVCEVLKVKPELVKLESHIKNDLGADSLDTVSLLMSLEDVFKEPISDETALTLETVGDVVAFINSRKNQVAAV